MDFARKQLEKYGWTDGKGLGKHEDGISQALKPKLKRSAAGVGHDSAADFTEHWWTQLYDKAASNLVVEERNGMTKKIKTYDKTGFEITNSSWKLNKKFKKKNEKLYNNSFIKTAILTNGGSKTEKVVESESEDEEMEKIDVKMTDEQLFAACGGRTAHKGARHGLRALGKLARIEQQEKLLLTLPQYKDYSHATNSYEKFHTRDEQVLERLNLDSDSETIKAVKKKKKKKHCMVHQDINPNAKNTSEANFGIEHQENDALFFKNKGKRVDHDTNSIINDEVQLENENYKTSKKRKTKKFLVNDNEQTTVIKNGKSNKISAKSKKAEIQIGNPSEFVNLSIDGDGEIVSPYFENKSIEELGNKTLKSENCSKKSRKSKKVVVENGADKNDVNSNRFLGCKTKKSICKNESISQTDYFLANDSYS